LSDANFNLDCIEAEVTKTEQEKAGMVSTKEIALNRGKPLSKYERNIAIFNWLHTLDETAIIAHDHEHEQLGDE
jgi:hypothetical protein